jgi:hypothetical protein
MSSPRQALSQATGQHIRHVQIALEAVRQDNSDLADAVSYLNSHGGDITAARALHHSRALRGENPGGRLADPGAGSDDHYSLSAE